MSISILIKTEGQPPQELTDLSGFMLVAIPIKDPSNNTAFLSAGLPPKAIAECGAFAIRTAKHLLTGEKLTPLGQPLTPSESRIIKPRGVK